MGKTIQAHHFIYPSPDHPEQEHKESVFKGEHHVITRLQWYTRKEVSLGLINWLKFFVVLNEGRAIDIDNIKELQE